MYDLGHIVNSTRQATLTELDDVEGDGVNLAHYLVRVDLFTNQVVLIQRALLPAGVVFKDAE